MGAALKKALHYGALALGALYPLALLIVTLSIALVGERWWATAGVMYLPRVAFAAPLPVVVLLLAWHRLHRLLLLQVGSLLLVLFPLMGFVLPTPHARASTAGGIRVLSYNVNSGGNDEPGIVAEVARFSPDVVLFQEAGNEAEALAHLLGALYPVTAFSNQFVVASRYPIASTLTPDKVPLEGKMRSPRFIVYSLDTPLGRIAFYDVHPISPREGLAAIRGRGLPRELLSGRLLRGAHVSLLESLDRLRELQVQSIAEHAGREAVPVVIAGDTNLTGLSPVLRRYLGGYEDGFAAAGWGFGYTFPTYKRAAWMRIDRVLVSHALRVVGFQVGTSRVSDHRCVVADLRRAED